MKCPHCNEALEIDYNDANFVWNWNYDCYERAVYVFCPRCSRNFVYKELWDCIREDRDSLRELDK